VIALTVILFSDSSTNWGQAMPVVVASIVLYFSIGKRIDHLESKIDAKKSKTNKLHQ